MKVINKAVQSRIVLLLICCGAFFLGGCSARPAVPVGEVPPFSAPNSQEVSSTRAMVEQHMSEAGFKVYQTGPEFQRVNKIVSRISAASGAQGFSYPVYIADAGDDVNAMAVQDNTIVVYRTLLSRVPDDDELATVLSHEIAHILAKHGSDDSSESRATAVSVGSSILGTVAAVGAALAGAGGAANIAGDATEAAASIAGEGALVRSYDRGLEYEADHIGLMLMGKAGYDPNAAIRFWGKAEQIFGDKNSYAFLSTHPSSDDRMEHLRAALPKAMAYYEVAKTHQVASAPVESKAKEGKGKKQKK